MNLYQHSVSNTLLSNMQQAFVPTQIVNNQVPSHSTLSTNTHVIYPQNQSFTGQSLTGQCNNNAYDQNNGMSNGMSNGMQSIPPWAANMCRQLDNIQGQLETQNMRWQSVESKLSHQGDRMTNIEAQIAQLNHVKHSVSQNTRNIESVNVQVTSLKAQISDHDQTVLQYNNICDSLISANTDLQSKFNDLTSRMTTVEDKCVDMQWRNMRENLIFTGIRESELQYDMRGKIVPEDCETIIKRFLRNEMNVSNDIEFDRVHRLGKFKRGQQYPRPIIAKFTNYKDKEAIRQLAPQTLIGKSYGVREHFPQEIEEQRKILYPVAKSARQNPNNKVRLVRDKLFINGEQHIPNPTVEQQRFQTNNQQNNAYRQQRTRQQNTTYIGQRFNQQPPVYTGGNTNFSHDQPQYTSRVQRSAESSSSWNFPVRPRESQQQSSVNAHTQNDFRTPNRFGPFMGDSMGERISAAGKQKAKSPIDQDLTLKKQKPGGGENEGIEMDTYSIGVTEVASDNVSVPGSVENGDITRL